MRPRKIQRLSAALAALALLAACDSDEPDRAASGERAERPSSGVAAPPPPPPDAGTAAGHAADPARVAVPDAPRDPPRATIVLSAPRPVARASQPGEGHAGVVALGEPVVRGTTTGQDANEGVARVRVSFREEVTCAGAGARPVAHRRTRYFPPPQIERIRSRPGARIPVRADRSVRIALGTRRCGAGGGAATVHGELWGEAINGSGLEAVTPHIRFRYEGRG